MCAHARHLRDHKDTQCNHQTEVEPERGEQFEADGCARGSAPCDAVRVTVAREISKKSFLMRRKRQHDQNTGSSEKAECRSGRASMARSMHRQRTKSAVQLSAANR